MGIKYFKVVSRNAVRVKVRITSTEGDVNETLNNKQLLAGQATEINFEGLDVKFREGVTYTFTLTAADGGALELENFKACNSANSGNGQMDISQEGPGHAFCEISYKY